MLYIAISSPCIVKQSPQHFASIPSDGRRGASRGVHGVEDFRIPAASRRATWQSVHALESWLTAKRPANGIPSLRAEPGGMLLAGAICMNVTTVEGMQSTGDPLWHLGLHQAEGLRSWSGGDAVVTPCRAYGETE